LASLLFQRFDSLCDSGLRNRQYLRRSGEATRFKHGNEGCQLGAVEHERSRE
jgi:hypothetical protein